MRRGDGFADRGLLPPNCSLGKWERFKVARCTEHDHRLVILEFRRRPLLIARQFQRNALAFFLESGGKRSAFHDTAILRLPTPRKPPKSMTAALENRYSRLSRRPGRGLTRGVRRGPVCGCTAGIS
jgi:hypothetical protein